MISLKFSRDRYPRARAFAAWTKPFRFSSSPLTVHWRTTEGLHPSDAATSGRTPQPVEGANIDTYKMEAASFRLTGIYGTRQLGGEDHGWVANFSIRSVMKWPITIFGTGKQLRDIIYATDICEAFDAFYRTRKSGIYNIGGGELTMISLLECIDLIQEINGERPDVNFAPDRHGDLRYFVCDISKAQKELNWSPKILPEEGISRLMKWIKNNSSLFLGRES